MTSLTRAIILLLLIYYCDGKGKYSQEANKPKVKTEFSQSKNLKALRELDKPFRMHKINLVWIKAKHRLTDPKLQSLFSDLKIQDKEEIAFKHIKSDGKDESGLEEARLRKKLIGIMSTYGLLEHFEEVTDPELLKKHKQFKDSSNYIAKDVFKDKRLNKLWAKAERGGFSHEELEALKEEFSHHQDKIDEYMSLLSEIEAGDPDKHKNSLHDKPESLNVVLNEEEMSNDVPGQKKDYLAKANLLKEKHLEVRSGYDHLEGITAKGPNHKEFVDPKVQGLWRMAVEAKFSNTELASLKEELLHYETRLLKLRHLHTEAALEAARKGKDYKPNKTSDTHISQHTRNVEKLHRDIEAKIMQKHVEL
ncbi:PREDICTED: alpha-2-macroglobulin receptor-associated protein [Ceratosolen solmsi marchali]|uniref:Alpha-2-macroglobulin receptor-associated protein n=1 Tax=Ceratosolen solmsi marchali TaxID=326594 RepID=A0AAJ6YIB6_9HYME|nr:PREDICTED: alpha-2-macroglobulin receptor-associated protein [Ceratosolen solmsi marchali]